MYQWDSVTVYERKKCVCVCEGERGWAHNVGSDTQREHTVLVKQTESVHCVLYYTHTLMVLL